MEKVSAACAMEWSIELEKGLRSKIPGRAVEAIFVIGRRLEKWSREPEPNMVVCNTFGLVPEEDKLFLNTIFLRLADAFRLGDKPVRLAVVRIFKSIFKLSRSKKRSERRLGILSHGRVQNPSELLRRVKDVYDTGDLESRVMSLLLFGCWVDFVGHCSQIRHMIFTSLVSSHDLEVRASLFAAACFCDVSDDFPLVVLEMINDMVASEKLSQTNRLAAVRVLAKMGSSHSIACKAYKNVLKLMLDCSEENFLVVGLVSLTKLASSSTEFASRQTDYILSFCSTDKTSRMQSVALRCLHFLVRRGMCYAFIRTNLITILSSFLDDSGCLLDMQIEALQILHKVVLYKLGSVHETEYAQLSHIVEKASHSPVILRNYAAMKIMVDLSIKLYRSRSEKSVEVSSLSLLSQLFALIIDEVILLDRRSSNLCQVQSAEDTDLRNLFNLLLVLVGEHLDFKFVLLDKVSLFIQNSASKSDNPRESEKEPAPAHDNLIEIEQERLLADDNSMEIEQESVLANGIVNEEKETGVIIRSRLLGHMHKFLERFLENFIDTDLSLDQFHKKVKHMVESVRLSNLFDSYTHTIYSVLLHSPVIWHRLMMEKRETCDDENSGISFADSSDEHEIFSLECAKKMLMQGDYWSAYRAGMLAACLGAWCTSAFIFKELKTKVQSDTCFRWLESLVYFALAEGKTRLWISRIGSSRLVLWLGSNGCLPELFQNTDKINDEGDFSLLLHDAKRYLLFSAERLETNFAVFCFQRWFVALKVNLWGAAIDLTKCSTLSNHDNRTLSRCNSLQQFTQVSIQLQKLAREFDLLAVSFIDIDQSSLKLIGSLALSCSLLAFVAEFATNASNSSSSRNDFKLSLIQDLVLRLRHLDLELSKKLSKLVNFSEYPRNSLNMWPRNQIPCAVGVVSDLVALCGEAVSGIACLKNQEIGEDRDEVVSEPANNGVNQVLEIVKKWIRIPFWTPKYFFHTRPAMGSELFAFSPDNKNAEKIWVMQGFHLSLNLCLKLKNMPSYLTPTIRNLHCLLYLGPSSSPRKKGKCQASTSAPWKDDEMLEMNEILLRHVTEESGERRSCAKRLRGNDDAVYAFVHFDPGKRGQGFSSCLLDVSWLPAGSYPLKWVSLCIDDKGSCWNLLPLNPGPVFTVSESSSMDISR